MNLLLDTHAFLWFLNGDEQLSNKARKNIENTKQVKFISIASIWEISIKISLGKLTLNTTLEDLKWKFLKTILRFFP